MQEINVIVVDRGRKYLYLRYTDPVTGQKVEKSARTTKKKEAMKRAGEWQTELENGIVSSRASLRWESFRDAYENHVDETLSAGTLSKVCNMFNVASQLMSPDSVRRVTPQWISEFQSRLLRAGRKQSTIESHCRHLKASLNWAKQQQLIKDVPEFPKLKRARSARLMKGRPITPDEFKRIKAAAATTSKPNQVESVQQLLDGLWLSGLRLREALGLTWEQWADGIRVDATGRYVKLIIPKECEKGAKDRIYPVTPEFAKFLTAIPTAERSGFVFNVQTKRGVSRRKDTVSKLISDLGRAANIKVDEQAGTDVFATAHDFRRAFGYRWSRRVTVMVLKELMRHESVSTTEKYYVHIDADNTAALLENLDAD